MASEGAKIAVVDMDKARGERVADEIVQTGGDAAGFVVDVSLPDHRKARSGRGGQMGPDRHPGQQRGDIDNKHILDITKSSGTR